MRFKHGWVPDKIDQRDRLYRKVSRPRLEPLPPSVDLRSQCSPVEDQGSLGSCTANALVGALEFLELKSGQPFEDLSRLFLYYNERALEGTVRQDAGACLRDGIKTLAKQGVCTEIDWPYDTSVFYEKPTLKCYNDAASHKILSYNRLLSLDDMMNCLADGFPFVFGFTVFSGFEADDVAKTGVVFMPEDSEENLGGHAVMAVGYDQAAKRFIVRNSWGATWGQNGYFTIPFEYLETMADDFWQISK